MPTAIDEDQCAIDPEVAQVEQIEASIADPRTAAAVVARTRRTDQRRHLGQEVGDVGRPGLLESLCGDADHGIRKGKLRPRDARTRHDDRLLLRRGDVGGSGLRHRGRGRDRGEAEHEQRSPITQTRMKIDRIHLAHDPVPFLDCDARLPANGRDDGPSGMSVM